MSGRVERRFLRPTHLGASIVAFRARAPELAVVPWNGKRLLDGDDEELDEFEGLAGWWREAEHLWESHRALATRLSLREQIDFQGKTSRQFPTLAHRVVYTTSGQYLAACRVDDPNVLIEQTLYWCPVDTIEEGRYLCAVVNSKALAEAVIPLQSRGQHNPRHFAMSLFAIAFPIFDAGNALHADIATLAARAEAVVAELHFEDSWRFQKARRVTREALREDGVALQIDRAVHELIARASSRTGGRPEVTTAEERQTPDLMRTLARSQRRIARASRPPHATRPPASKDPVNLTDTDQAAE